MHPQRTLLAVINVLGGIAVLGSYAYGIATHSDAGAVLWGAVPRALRPLYQVAMLAAAAGYLAVLYGLLTGVDPDATRLPGGLGYSTLYAIFLAILVPSALWMSATFAYHADPSATRWWILRGLLCLVAAGALALVAAIATLSPRPGNQAVALAGAIAFALHVTVLDAIVWPAYYRGA